ncbi:MAG: type II secretion system GspH family protein [Verrucomicrobiae bacterium]|nr:type II secretion system GspH family protein [Verrucomicrobiae bacterium]
MNRFANRCAAFTLLELLAAITVLVLLSGALFAVFNQASRTWTLAESRTETFQAARLALELIARELEGAMVASNSVSGQQITFRTFEDANAVPGGGSTQATPPNDQIYFVAAPGGEKSDEIDLTELGYAVVFTPGNYVTMKGGYYYLLRHQVRSSGAGWDFFTNPNWHATPIISTRNRVPLVDNVLRFELDYETPGGPDPQGTRRVDDWDNRTNELPRAVHITLAVLDRRSAARLNAVCNGGSLSGAKLADIPYNIQNSTVLQPAEKNVLREGLRVFYRTVHLRNAQ